MKDKIIIGLLAISIIFNIVNFVRSTSSSSTEQAATSQTDTTKAKAAPAEPIEVADVMTKFQRHMNKLWFAASNENWALANFYVHELDESMDVIENNNLVDNGANLSQLIKIMGKAPLNELHDAVNAQNPAKFKEKYMTMINNCNACHATAKHEYLVIKVPTVPAFDNQDYKKQ